MFETFKESLSNQTRRSALRRVLIADDDPVIVESLLGLLAEWGYDPIAVRNGSDALEMLNAHGAPRLAVLDWMLPDIYGTEICRRVRASQSLHYTYVILLTGCDQSTNVVDGLAAGADDYLLKPYDPFELHARLETGSRIVVQKALDESEQRLQGAFEQAGVPIALVDLSGRWLQVNRAMCDFLGYTSGEFLATNIHAFTHPDDLPKSVRSLQHFLEGNLGIIQMEKRYMHKDGHSVWGLLTASPVSSLNGKPAYLVAQIQDISKRMRAEEALQEGKSRLQLLLDSTAEGIYGFDLAGNCTFSNRACLSLLGYKDSSSLLGKNMHSLVHHSYADGSPFPAEQCSIHNIHQQGEGTHVDSDVKWKADGTTFSCECWYHPVLREGKAVGFVVTFVDITKRKEAEDALRAEHLESELFINSVPSILIGTDAVGQITRWNLAASNAFALSASEVCGKTLKDCGIKWVTRNFEAEIDSWVRSDGQRKSVELIFEKEGEQRFLGSAIHRVMFANENTFGLLITGADITERIRLEQQLRQAQKLEAIGQLAAGIAHEINTPIQYVGDNNTFIKQSWASIGEVARAAQRVDEESRGGKVSNGTLDELSRSIKDADLAYLIEEIPKAIEQSLDGVHRVAGIVRAMKDFSHPCSEEKAALNINRAIETTITVARNEWKYVAEVETNLDLTLPLVPCHAGEFNQVVLNLLINAAHAIRQMVGDGTDGKGKITVTTSRDGDEVEVSIRDTGCGIPKEIQARVFEPFFTTKPVGQGTGQGLALAHTSIVRRHGGRLWFETVPGNGTTFFIRLPLSPSMTAS